MTDDIKIESISPRIRYIGDGNTTHFAFPFPVFQEEDMDVYLDDQLQTTGYSVSGAGLTNGGEIIFNTAPLPQQVVTLLRNLEIKRTSDFQEGGAFRAKAINHELDYQVACIQQINEQTQRTVKFPPYSEANNTVFLPIPQPGKAVIWDEAGVNLANSSTPIDQVENTVKKAAAESVASADAASKSQQSVSQSAAEALASQAVVANSVEQARKFAQGAPGECVGESAKTWAERAEQAAVESEGIIYSRINSCILEIPQKINLDFDNGTMTLKAGSKIPFLTGSGAVDITVPVDLTTISYGSGSDDGYWAVTADGRNLRFAAYVNTYSGETPPTASAADTIWFDTKRQKVFYATSKLDFSEEISLPFCYVSRNGGIITKIKNIFNGLGFIGNACWFDQGIKVLMFNGRNADGTLRNKEFVTGGLVWQQTSYKGDLQFTILASENRGKILLIRPNYVFVGQKVPFEKSSIWIDPQSNISRFSVSTFTEWQINPLTIVGKFTCDGTRITSMEINQPVSLVSQKELDDSVVHAVFSRVTNCILTAPIGVMSAAATPEDGVPRVNVHKGLTVLMPNGLRPDGTKNNLVYTVPDNLILKAFSARENIHFVLSDGGVRTYKTSEYSESDSAPDWSSKSYFLWFDKKNNVTWLKDGTNDTPKIRPLAIVGETTVSNTNVITSLRPYPVMSLSSLNDMEKLVSGKTNYFKLQIPGQTLPLLVQFGKVAKGGNGLSNVNVTYPVAFSTTNRSVLKCLTDTRNSGTSFWSSISIWDETNSGFTTQRDGAFGFNWIAIGY